MKHALTNPLPTLAAWALALMLAMHSLPAQTRVPFTPNMDTYGCGQLIQDAVFKSVTLRAGDWFRLMTSQTVQGTPDYTATLESQGTGGNLYRIQLSASLPAGTVLYLGNNLEVNVDEFLWPGDANADGFRNTLDVFLIALAMRAASTTQASNPGFTLCSNPPNSPPDPAQVDPALSQFHPVPACTGGITLNGRFISYAHADCNLDGQVDNTDMEVLRNVIRPMYLPDLLVDQTVGITLDAVMDPSGILLRGVSPAGNRLMEVPFHINVSSVPQQTGQPAPKVLGVVFSRAVADDPPCVVQEISATFQQSAVITNLNKYLRCQTFWPDLLQWPTPTPCGNLTENVLDVAVFSTDSTYAATLTAGQNVLTCGVTLEDVMTSAGNNTCPVIGAVYNGVGFVYDPATNSYKTVGFSCSAETTQVNLDEVKAASLIIRDDPNDVGAMPYAPNYALGSPDLWVKKTADPRDEKPEWQNPVPGTTMQVFARVRNATTKPTWATVDVYWTLSDGNASGKDAVSATQGGLIGRQTLQIPAGSSKLVSLPWTVPTLPGAPRGFRLAAEVRPAGPSASIPSSTSSLTSLCASRAGVAMRAQHRLRAVKGKPTAADKANFTFTAPAGLTPSRLTLRRISGTGSAGTLVAEGIKASSATTGFKAVGSTLTLQSATGTLGDFKPGTSVSLTFHSLAGKVTTLSATDRYVLEWTPTAPPTDKSAALSVTSVVLEVSTL